MFPSVYNEDKLHLDALFILYLKIENNLWRVLYCFPKMNVYHTATTTT